MASGVKVHEQCGEAFQKLFNKSVRFVIFKVEDKEVVVESARTIEELDAPKDDFTGNSKQAYQAFVQELKERTGGFMDCRYAVFDFQFSNHRGSGTFAKLDKILFLQLCPDGASVKQKMVYASSASALKTTLGAEKFLNLQVSDEKEMSHAAILGKLADKFKDN